MGPTDSFDRPVQVTFGGPQDDGRLGVSWTGDGRILYASRSIDGQQIWLFDPRTKTSRPLTSGALDTYPRSCGNDRHVVFSSTRDGGANLWRVNPEGSNLRQLTAEGGISHADCPSAGDWVVYTRGGLNEPGIVRISLDGSEKRVVLNGNATNPSVAGDNEQIAFYHYDMDSKKYMIGMVSASGGSLRTQAAPITAGSFSSPLRWTPDGRSVMYVRHEGSVSNLWRQAIGSGAMKQLTHFDSDRIFCFDLSRDGRMVVLSRGQISTDLVLIRDGPNPGDGTQR
jgi:TolB protein